MLNKSGLSFAALALLAGALSACSSTPKPTPYQLERFDSSISPYAHSFKATAASTCYAARRALLSQGYTVDAPKPEAVDGSKNFQSDNDTHVVIEFHIVCTSDFETAPNSTIYVNAIQDRYALKKSSTSASVGLSVLGAISLPIGSSDDALVKISSETIPSQAFYERYFGLVQYYLDVPLEKGPVPEPDTRLLEMIPTSKTTGTLMKDGPASGAAAEAVAAPVVAASATAVPAHVLPLVPVVPQVVPAVPPTAAPAAVPVAAPVVAAPPTAPVAAPTPLTASPSTAGSASVHLAPVPVSVPAPAPLAASAASAGTAASAASAAAMPAASNPGAPASSTAASGAPAGSMPASAVAVPTAASDTAASAASGASTPSSAN